MSTARIGSATITGTSTRSALVAARSRRRLIGWATWTIWLCASIR